MPAPDDPEALRTELDLIREAAAEAGRIAMRFFGKSPEVWMKEGQSPVSEADYAVDLYLRETLLGARPRYGWLSEETEDNPDRLTANRIFVVDPIDGTRAFIAGEKTWCVSIAIVENGRPLVGVLDCPVTGEIFTAVHGQGAFERGTRLASQGDSAAPRIGGPKPMISALDAADRRDVRPVKYVPSLAYRIAMVARGEITATFVKANSHDWDLAAADLILEESGGSIRDPAGRLPLYASSAGHAHGPLAAGPHPLVDRMAQVLTKF